MNQHSEPQNPSTEVANDEVNGLYPDSPFDVEEPVVEILASHVVVFEDLDLFQQVGYINTICGNEAGDTWKAADHQIKIIRAEINEMEQAILNRDFDKMRDGVADALFTIAGMAHRLSLPLWDDWAEVNRSNMSKFDTSLEDAEATKQKYLNKGVETYHSEFDIAGKTIWVTRSAKEQPNGDEIIPENKWLKGQGFTEPKYSDLEGNLLWPYPDNALWQFSHFLANDYHARHEFVAAIAAVTRGQVLALTKQAWGEASSPEEIHRRILVEGACSKGIYDTTLDFALNFVGMLLHSYRPSFARESVPAEYLGYLAESGADALSENIAAVSSMKDEAALLVRQAAAVLQADYETAYTWLSGLAMTLLDTRVRYPTEIIPADTEQQDFLDIVSRYSDRIQAGDYSEVLQFTYADVVKEEKIHFISRQLSHRQVNDIAAVILTRVLGTMHDFESRMPPKEVAIEGEVADAESQSGH